MAIVIVAMAAVIGAAAPAGAGPPDPLPWLRTYVGPDSVDVSQIAVIVAQECGNDLDRGVRDNGAQGVPRIAVVGDSVEDQTRTPLMFDGSYRWMYATHCGEKFATAVNSGRIFDAVSTNPDVMVFALGANDMSNLWHVDPNLLPGALATFNQMLDATESVPCRVLINLPDVIPWYVTGQDAATWQYLSNNINAAMDAAQARHGVHVADWRSRVAFYPPAFLADGLHLTGFGINERINAALETASQCLPPDSPASVGAVAANGTAAVWWDPLPGPEQVNQYKVTASDGRAIFTTSTNINFPGLTNGVAYQFQVQAINGSGLGPPTAWTAPVVPSAAGARFHAVAPVRVLDTRYGQGKPGGFLPGDAFRLSLNGAVPPGTSAVVLNVTATGQSTNTFLTVWPSGQSRPLASNLNPHPGIDAVPAMVTTRVGSDGAVDLYNNAGTVDVIADVVGYYDAPGGSSGSLFVPVNPTRLVDTRSGTGGKSTRFGSMETMTLAIPSLPTDATAAVLNVTSTNTTAPGFVTVWPHGQSRPLASNLNPQPGLTRANLTVSKLGPGRTVDLFNNTALTDLVVDLVGYDTADGALHGGSLYYPITPERLYDTRFGTGGIPGPISNAGNLWLGLASHGAVPAGGVTAVDANLTVTGASAGGHTTVWPSGTRPTSSNLNYQPGETVANRDPIGLSAGTALFWSAASSINYIIDVDGWWGPPL